MRRLSSGSVTSDQSISFDLDLDLDLARLVVGVSVGEASGLLDLELEERDRCRGGAILEPSSLKVSVLNFSSFFSLEILVCSTSFTM